MTIDVTIVDRIAIVRLNRPEVRNAVNPITALALYKAFLEIEADIAIDAAILTGSGGHFCAGFDLDAAANEEGKKWLSEVDIAPAWQGPICDPIPGPMGPTRLMLQKPVIAAIEGYAVAGGLELAAWCHMRVAARTAVFGVFCRRWGVPLIDGGTVRLPRIIGQGRANDLILTGRGVEAQEAFQMGLVDRLVDTGDALDSALELAKSLARFPQSCLQADLASAQISQQDFTDAIKREWRSVSAFIQEGQKGAGQFSKGEGRHGTF